MADTHTKVFDALENQDVDKKKPCVDAESIHVVTQQLEKKLDETALTAGNDDIFGVKNLKQKRDAHKTIEQVNAETQQKDFNSKLKYRKIAIWWLFFLMGFQIFFMNVIVGFLFFSQLVSLNWTFRLEAIELSHLTELAKWYTTATLAELLGVFCYVIKAVFAKPSIK